MTSRTPMTPEQLRARQDLMLIAAIAERGFALAAQLDNFDGAFNRISAMMDLEAVHEKTPLDLEAFAYADDANFAHDFFGIHRHFNRDTRELENNFSPRYTK